MNNSFTTNQTPTLQNFTWRGGKCPYYIRSFVIK